MKTMVIFSILAMAILLGGCASIISGSTKSISVKSVPDDIVFSVKEQRTGEIIHRGRTPQSFPLSTNGGYFRSREYEVTLVKEGFANKKIEIKSIVSGWYFPGNLGLTCLTIIGGTLGFLVIDPATGAMWTLDPMEITAIMETPEQFEERQLREKQEMERRIEEEKNRPIPGAGTVIPLGIQK
jgi:hypothetical protein